MTSMTQLQESLISAKPGHRMHLALKKLKMTFSSRSPHRRTLLKVWENKCIVATKQYRGTDGRGAIIIIIIIKRDKVTLHQLQNTNSLRDTGDNTTDMVFEDEPAVKLHAKNDRVGTSANGTSAGLGLAQPSPWWLASPWGGLTLLDLLTTKALVLLGFSILHEWLHHS